jgi:hypothetical protein
MWTFLETMQDDVKAKRFLILGCGESTLGMNVNPTIRGQVPIGCDKAAAVSHRTIGRHTESEAVVHNFDTWAGWVIE